MDVVIEGRVAGTDWKQAMMARCTGLAGRLAALHAPAWNGQRVVCEMACQGVWPCHEARIVLGALDMRPADFDIVTAGEAR